MTEENKIRQKYFEDKSKFAYKLAQENKFFRKARAVILKGDKFIFIKGVNSRHKYIEPGGGVDDGESLKHAVEREALEETNIKCKAVKLLGKNYYSFTLHNEGKPFVSKRVEFFYLCHYISEMDGEIIGVPGEFKYKVELEELPLERLNETTLPRRVIAEIEKYMEGRKNK